MQTPAATLPKTCRQRPARAAAITALPAFVEDGVPSAVVAMAAAYVLITIVYSLLGGALFLLGYYALAWRLMSLVLPPETALWAGGAGCQRLASPTGVQLIGPLGAALDALAEWRVAHAPAG